MKILLSNDDGIHAEGIRALCDALKDEHDIYVVAPDTQKSAAGHSVTYFREAHDANRVDIPGVKEAWEVVGGTPADCVYFALYGLIKEKIDLVISGINHGENLSSDCMYSGTVAAALEAYIAGVPAIATSYCSYTEKTFEDAAEIIRDFICEFMKDENRNYCLNMNIPAIKKEEMKGFRITHFDGERIYANKVQVNEINDQTVNLSCFTNGIETRDMKEDTGDVSAIHQGYVSLTPLAYDFVKHSAIEDMKHFEQLSIMKERD